MSCFRPDPELYYDRYHFGLTYYIDVANSEMTLLDYQIAVNTYLGLRYVSTIQLIKALGGGWCLIKFAAYNK
jgi:multidrug efflux system outer membrane protein